ncbi:hypothetical protein PpBr36_04469 [Pyricularia pennisetigena]|uniref:hypothetical protein n=1 Tax=Pyricularia pennisetigena TaxID=1578925 RepID=UPI00115200BE|nr:hypothetical protein PpBr36_04469 [Pyricularia pennisetigena]TLS27199.1 hypothetical protein PpBr36_04469 [Pyricularia pennisetigena]
MGQQPSSPVPGTKFRVIGAGMSRTGTKSFNEALRILLDGPVHDSGIQSCAGSRRQRHQWLELMELAVDCRTVSDRKRIEWLLADLLEGYTSTMDIPANMMYEEILSVFPDAVVICTTRDAVPWAISMCRLADSLSMFYVPWVAYWLPGVGYFSRWMDLQKRLMALRLGYDDYRVESIRDHENTLKKVIPPEKLFFYRVSDGWEPLCKILNLPVPDVPFPHNNNTTDAQGTVNEILVMGLLAWTGILAGFGAAAWLAWRAFSYRS